MALCNVHTCDGAQTNWLLGRTFAHGWVLFTAPKAKPTVKASGEVTFECIALATGLKFCPWCGKKLKVPPFITQEQFENGPSAGIKATLDALSECQVTYGRGEG